VALRQQGKSEEAQEEFRKAASLDPRLTPPPAPKE
jgi:Tfp pilus assembly protein PilF